MIRPNSRPATTLVAGTLIGAALLACKKDDDEAASSNATASVAAAAPAATPSKVGKAISSKKIASSTSGGIWFPDFNTKRVLGDTGKDYFEAMQHCLDQNMALCTEDQWTRVCETTPEAAKLESWTASWSGTQAVVRGGSACSDRKTVAGSEKSATRAAVCCDRAVGIRSSSNPNAAFMKAAQLDQLKYENALNKRDLTGLEGQWDEGGVLLDGKQLSLSAMKSGQKSYWSAQNVKWTLYDVCEVSIGDIEVAERKEKGLIHDCRTVVRIGDKLSVMKQTLWRFKHDVSKPNRVTGIQHHAYTRKAQPL